MHALAALAATFALALAAAPAPSSPAPSSSPPPAAAPASAVQEHTLKNGMKVLLLEDHAAPVATFSVFYRVGSRNEHVGNTGSTHLLEHMLFKGTKRFKKGEIMSALDRIGAQWNATTFYDYTNYYETVPVDQLEFAIGLEADRMVNSLILDAERDLERIVVRNEFERAENSPISVLSRDLWSTAFKAHPYHHPVIGWRSDVEQVPTSQLRAFYKTFYQPGNAVAVVVGDFKASAALALVRKHFEPLPGGHAFPRVYTTEPPQKGERRFVVRQPGDLKVVGLGWKAPPAADKDTVALKLLHLVLSGELDLGPFGDPLDPGISNRLYQALVEKELATGAGVDYVPLKDPGLFAVMALPRPDVEHERVEKAIRAEIERLKGELVPREELERAKTRAAAAYALQQDGTSGRAMLLGYFAAIADWRLADEFPQRLRAVTAEDLRRVANTYFVDSQLSTGWFIPAAGTGAGRERAEGPIARASRQLLAVQPLGPLPPPKSAGPRATSPVQRAVLGNGLVVLVRENRASPIFSISGRVMAGGVFDPPGKPDTAELTAAALMRGTVRRSKLEIARSLEEVGASLDYGAGAEEVSFGAAGLSQDFDRILDLLAETLTEPAFPKEEVEKLKRETVAGLQQAEDSPSVKGRRAFYQGLYPKGHPYYQYPLEEELAAVRALTPEALRAFHRRHYGANNTVIAIVGDVTAPHVIQAVRARFGPMQKVEAAKVVIPPVPLRAQAGREVVFVPEKANVDVLFGHQGEITRTEPDYYPAQVANFAFGGSASGRLFQQVRDRLGLTYGIYASLSASHGAGPWAISMTLNPENVDQALGVVKQMAEQFVKRGLTPAELAAAKSTLMGKYKVGLATNAGMASVLALFESYGFPPDFVERHPELIGAVTEAQIAKVLERSFHPDRALTVIAGTYPAPAQAPSPEPQKK